MRIVCFVHAIASCWHNGNAHFLRGIGSELQYRGHDVRKGVRSAILLRFP